MQVSIQQHLLGGNFALVTKNDLNGYTNPGVLAGTIGNKIADTAVFDLSKADAAKAWELRQDLISSFRQWMLTNIYLLQESHYIKIIMHM